MFTPLLFALVACLPIAETDTSAPGDTDTASDTDVPPPEPWWFQVVSDGDVHIAQACWTIDPWTWEPRLHAVGWFEGTAWFGAAADVVLTADGVDGFLLELDDAGRLVRVVPLGGPGDQRALACVGSSTVSVAGIFGGALQTPDVAEPLVATTDADVFIYEERLPGNGTPGGPALDHVVAGRTADLGVHCSLYEVCRVFGTFEGEITVWPGRAENWTATSRGGRDAYYARPSSPLLLQGPGTEIVRQITSYAGMAGPGIPRVDVNWLVGAAGTGAEVRVGDTVTPVPDTRGGTDALTMTIGDWLEDATGPASVELNGSVGDDVADRVTFASDLLTAGTFGAGVSDAAGTFGAITFPSSGYTDVYLAAQTGWGGEHVDVHVFGSEGDDALTDAIFYSGRGPGGSAWPDGGIAFGTFGGERFTARGAGEVTSCGDPSTWLLSFDDILVPTWLGVGCGLELTDATFAEDGSALLVASFEEGAYLKLQTRNIGPLAVGGTGGAFIASWPPEL